MTTRGGTKADLLRAIYDRDATITALRRDIDGDWRAVALMDELNRVRTQRDDALAELTEARAQIVALRASLNEEPNQ